MADAVGRKEAGFQAGKGRRKGAEEKRSRGVKKNAVSRCFQRNEFPSLLLFSLLLYSFTPLLLYSFTPLLLYSFTPLLLYSFFSRFNGTTSGGAAVERS